MLGLVEQDSENKATNIQPLMYNPAKDEEINLNFFDGKPVQQNTLRPPHAAPFLKK